MADDQDSSNDVGEGGDVQENDYDETTPVITADATTSPFDDYDDEPIEDYVVKLVVNEQPDGASVSPLVDAYATDIYGNTISKTTLIDSINGYTTAAYDELSGNGTAVTGGKGLFGWSTQKLIIVGLIALCIIGIILTILFLFIGKKLRNKRSTPAGTTTTTKAVVTKNVSPDPKYQPVPNV